VKGLVELHGGEVSAHSDGPGKRARFAIRLPLDDRRTVPDNSQQPAGTASRGRNVVVIEDNRDAADTLAEALGLSGHRVAVAYGGYAGLASVRASRPDIVLCDVGLPGMDGYAVARAIRSDPAQRPICRVALTGYAGPEDIEQSRAAGFYHHLAKPPSRSSSSGFSRACLRRRVIRDGSRML
jgi:CheY-like chemotaxis protein